jgi:hypothetical protein
VWETDRTTSGTSGADGNPRGTCGRDRTNRPFSATALGQALKWLLKGTSLVREPVLAFVLLQLLSKWSSEWPASISLICLLAALNLFMVGFTRICWLAVRRGDEFSRLGVLCTLGLGIAIGTVCLKVIPLGVSGHLDWFLAIITIAGIAAVPLFLVTTGFIRLPRSFWLFTGRQLVGFATATSVLLVFLGAYGRKEDLFTPHSSLWELAKSFGPLVVQGVKNLVSGETLGTGAKTADVLVYMVGWIVFVLIAGVEVSLIADRASEEMAQIQSNTARAHRAPAGRLEGRWRWPRKGAD